MIEKGKVGKKIDGVIPIKEDIIVLDEPIIDNLPGINANKINPDIEILGDIGVSKAFTKQQNVGILTLGDQAYTGFGFKPKKVMIQAEGGSVGLGYFDVNGVKHDQQAGVDSDGHLVYIIEGVNIATGSLKEFIDDGFIITWDRIDDVALSFSMTCFSEV